LLLAQMTHFFGVMLWGASALALVAGQLGGSWPDALGWTLAALAVPAVLRVDAAHKKWRAARRRPV
jgi:hypothetical protein